MDLEGIEAAGEDKLKSVREDEKWRRWWLLAAAISEDLKHAARHMDLTLITAIFSISLTAVVMQKSLVCFLQINWGFLLLYSELQKRYFAKMAKLWSNVDMDMTNVPRFKRIWAFTMMTS